MTTPFTASGPCAAPRAGSTPSARRYEREFPSAVKCLLTDRQALTAYLRFPAEHWRRIRHTNLIERTFGETRRRVKVIGRLPGEASCLSLVWAVLDRASRGWRGLTYTPATARHLNELRHQLHPDDTNEASPPRLSPPLRNHDHRNLRPDRCYTRSGTPPAVMEDPLRPSPDWNYVLTPPHRKPTAASSFHTPLSRSHWTGLPERPVRRRGCGERGLTATGPRRRQFATCRRGLAR